MAQSAEEIYNQLLLIKEVTPSISAITSTSNVSLWKTFYATVATALSIFTEKQDAFKKDVEYQKKSTPVYVPAYFIDKALNEFQYAPGDTDRGVIKIDDQFLISYTIVDPTSRIIKYASAIQSSISRLCTIKVAKQIDNAPAVLTNDELNAAINYFDRIKGAGILLRVESFPADKLFLEMDLYFSGMYGELTVKDNVRLAIQEYLKNLEFDGSLVINKMIDAIQAVEGISDVFIKSSEYLPDGGNRTSFTRAVASKSGYFNLDWDNSVINMILDK